jgi:protease-4
MVESMQTHVDSTYGNRRTGAQLPACPCIGGFPELLSCHLGPFNLRQRGRRHFTGAMLGLALVFWMACHPAQAQKEAPKKVIPVFRLSGMISEKPADESFAFMPSASVSLKDLVSRFKKAASDPAVTAVVVLPETLAMSLAQVEELRAAMALVRQRGKDVYVHADSFMPGGYLLACGATRISVVPTGMILIPGLHSSSLHIRGLLDLLGVKPDFLTAGKFKSAAELYMREQPSPEAEQMMNWLMDGWHASYVDLIARGRKAKEEQVRQWLDNGLYTAEQAWREGLIDAVEPVQDFEAALKKEHGEDVVFEKKYGVNKQPELDFSSPFALFKIWTDLLTGAQKKTAAKPAIGIVYVEGPIMTGAGDFTPFGGGIAALSTEIRRALEKAGSDDSIKAVVLRIDSPGGSATASDIILDATKRLKEKKPFVVSMGGVAGSGGYYVACGADTIFADATTLTGSIGVLSGKLATTEMWRKIGVTFKEYKRGKNAGILSTDEVFTESERARMRGFVDDIYGVFKNHVQSIRGNRLKEPLENIAGGRVYTGRQALDLGLVDRLGSLSDAVEYAAEKARLTDYEERVVPEAKNFLEQLMDDVSGRKDEPGRIGLGADRSLLLRQAAPWLQNLDPQRVKAVLSALSRLEILRAEGVVLTMPEILQP